MGLMTNLAGQTDAMAWQTSNMVMKIRKKSGVIDTIVEMLDGWRLHLSGRNASVLAFCTFLSIFPLMLAATTILGFILEDNPELRNRIIESAADEIPVIGADIKASPDALSGSVWVVVAGLLGAIWSSTKSFVGLQGALDDTWEVPVDHRAGMPVQRGRAIVGLLIVGTAQVGVLAITAIVNAAGLPGISQFLVAFGTALLNMLVLATMYRFLTSGDPTWGEVWPGAIMAGIIFSVLQFFGPRLVETIATNAGDTYGTFAIVLGLITWLSFVAIALLMAAELNAAIVRLRENPHDVHDLGPDFDLAVR
jgi:membrane protein